MQTQVFISYCRSDVAPDSDRLHVFVDALRKADHSGFEVVVDYQHSDAGIGANLPAFMERVDTADAVIVLLTPGYRERIAARGDTGVYAEFRRIYDRLLSSQSRRTYNKDFVVLPIVFTGSFEDSCPAELRQLICGDLTWLYVTSRVESASVQPALRGRLTRVVDELSGRIAAIAATKARAYREQQQELFKSFLFHDTKSRWDKPENYPYLESAFVKTSTFLRVRNREISFLVGRKGSGKSTITHVLPLLSEPRPRAVLRIDFEQLPFEMSFNVLKSRPAAASDLRHAFSPILSYELLWDVFLHLFCAWQLRAELPARSGVRGKVFRSVLDEIGAASDAERDATATRALFVYAFERLTEFVDGIMRSNAGGSLAQAVAAFSAARFRAYVFGNGWAAVLKMLKRLRRDGAKLLVTIDGFDVKTQYFSIAADEQPAATTFEAELLLSFFQIVLNSRRAASASGMLYEVADFCVAIPHDRFLQVRAIDRDRYQYRHHFAAVSWSGIELSALVRKRLALLRKVSDPKGGSLESRLAAVMKSGYPELPDEVSFQFGAANYRLPLFIYVLRHSFWRPRDLLFYYAALLAAYDQLRRKHEAMPAGFVRQVVAGATQAVVEDEFLSEYSTSFSNLAEVLARFRQAPQVLGWPELENRIGPVKFDTAVPSGEQPTLEWKIELLYEVGALGVVLDRPTAERFSAFRHAFSFNEGDLLTKKLGRDVYRTLQFTLHPVLVEFLHLNTGANPELILPMDWQYLHDNEVLRRVNSA